MSFIDYIILAAALATVALFAFKAQRHVKGVSDFLSAGRVASRYLICVASAEAGMGLVTLVGMMEMYYQCGFGYSFWYSVSTPIALLLALYGFCIYRFRETRAMTLGQFFELRYNKPFRLTASIIQAIYGILSYAIYPAVGARFLIYYLDLPLHFTLFGATFSTLAAMMLAILAIAVLVSCLGGQITIMVTDCVQGIISYPIYALIVGYFLCKFSWSGEIMPAMLSRPAGQSFLDPFDVGNLRDFNLVYVVYGIVSMLLFRLSYAGGTSYDSCAKNAHESKMGALLGTWRWGFSGMMFILLAIAAYTFTNHAHFAEEANAAYRYLAEKTLDDIVPEGAGGLSLVDGPGTSVQAIRATLLDEYGQTQPRAKFSESFASPEEFYAETANPYLAATERQLTSPAGKKKFQTFRTIYSQMLVPVMLKSIFPAGITGLFCAMMVFFMLSTDTTYLHAWASVIVQDTIVPFRKRPFDKRTQINLIRAGIIGVAVFAFFFSLYFAQIDYILMFFAITGAIWSASGPIITFGLYWRRGTTFGAFASLILGALLAVGGLLAQKFWVPTIYPALANAGLVERLDRILKSISAPLSPYISWEMAADRFPLNSVEVVLLVNIITCIIYAGASLLTCRKPFNMKRMLHRGEYADDARADELRDPHPRGLVKFVRVIVGITGEYSRGDRILAWSVFLYSFVWNFAICFLLVVIWHKVSPFSAEQWGAYFYIKNLIVAGAIGVISTAWFCFCGTRDLLRLFRDLDKEENNILDDGRVEDNVNISDLPPAGRS